MQTRLLTATVVAAVISLVLPVTALAAFAWSSYTGPTIIQDNGNGTWNVQWTITVTTLSSPDNLVCVAAVVNSTRYAASCGNTTGTLTCTLSNLPNSATATWDISSYAGNCDSQSKKTQGPSGTISPLAVTLATFTADATPAGVTLSWETVSETDNAGFNIYRAEATLGSDDFSRPPGSSDFSRPTGPWTRLNPTLIPAAAPGSSEGHSYTFTDATAAPGASYWYLLEDIALDGTATQHPPVQVTVGEPNAVGLTDLFVVTTSVVTPFAVTTLVVALVALVAARQRSR